jgi:hypothetical protein
MNANDVLIERVTCGRCGKRPKAKFVETYGMVTSALRGVEGAHLPSTWRWRCRCGADWQVAENKLRDATASRPMVLGIDLG